MLYAVKQEGQRQFSKFSFKCKSVPVVNGTDSHQHPGASFLQPKLL